METIFALSNLIVMPFWLLITFLPKWRWTQRLMHSRLPIVLPALLYTLLVLPNLGDVLGGLANPTLAGVAALLSDPAAATIGWVHFLAFDLFVGTWIYLDAEARGVNVWVRPIFYFLTLMLGPVGFLSYWVVRAVQLARSGESIAAGTSA